MKVEPFMQVWQSILEAIPDTARPVLETFAATGLADINQIQSFTNLTRDRVNRAAERMLSGGLLTQLNRPLPRPDQRGKPASVFLLTKGGAEVLTQIGVKGAHPCGLKDDLTILHRLAMTDVHLTALKAGITIRTDRVLRFNERELRPDHLLTLEDGHSLILEVEQSASIDLLRRVVESLQNKQDFFASSASANVLSEVRMIVQLPRGKKWDKTLQIWGKALGVVMEKAGGKLPFRLFAIPRTEFLNAPDWGVERQLLWKEITVPEKSTAIQPISESVPQAMLYRTSHEERLVLTALWQDFLENVQPVLGQFPRPDPEFFQIMRLIYSASHDDQLSDIEQSAIPYASIYLLDQYLSMRNLRTELNRALHSGQHSTRWNPTMVLHRMQVVIDMFLKLQGWRSNSFLFAAAEMSNWNKDEVRTFSVTVKIRKPIILMTDDELVVPSDEEVKYTEQALSWVLCALFEYGPELGLGRVEFW